MPRTPGRLTLIIPARQNARPLRIPGSAIMSPKLIGLVPQSPRWPPLVRPPLARWNRSPVVLLADSVHAMLSRRGSRLPELLAWIHGHDVLSQGPE
jgi:hypothetical protein